MPTGIYKRIKPPWNKKEKIRLSCSQCGKSFEIHPYRKSSAKFCSKKCFFISKKGKQVWHKVKIKCTCLQCKKDFYIHHSRMTSGKNKYCSHNCYGRAEKEGITEIERERLSRIGILSVKKQFEFKGPTSIEKKVYEELKLRGILFEKQKLINGKFLVDAYIPSLNLIIEADGDYWHSREKTKKRDKAKNAYLTKCGFNLLRLTETEINNGSFRERLVN